MKSPNIVCTLLSCLSVTGFLYAGVGPGDAPENRFSETPLAIPLLKQVPVLDGLLSEGEWDDATQISGAVDQFERRPSVRPVEFRIKRSGHELYIAQRSRLKPNSPHPLWFNDGEDDNCVVVAIAPEAVNHGDTASHYVLRFNPAGLRVGWEITDSYRGVSLRWPHLPWQDRVVAVESENPYGYGFTEAPTETNRAEQSVLITNHVDTASGIWTSEMVIPVVCMNVQGFPSNQTWRLLLARDYPGVEQTAIVLSEDWRHGTANRARKIGFYNLYRHTKDYAFMAFPSNAMPVHICITTNPVISIGAEGAEAQIPSLYFSGYHFVDKPPQTSSKISMSVYNPIRNEIFVRTRLASVLRGLEADRLVLSIRRMGTDQPLLTHSVVNSSSNNVKAKMSDERVVRFPVPELVPGIYESKLEVFDKENAILGRNRELFVRYDHKQDLPWLGAGVGGAHTVLPGWTPIVTSKEAGNVLLGVTGRTYRVDNAGFFQQIKANGKELLSGPMRLDIIQNGNRVNLETAADPLKVNAQDDEVTFSGRLSGGGWKVGVQGRFEYDGFCRFELELDPGGEQTTDVVRLEIPLKDEVATYLHATGGIWMRDAVSAIILPEKRGKIWDSSRSRRPYNGRGLSVGNFLPYIWLGNDQYGLAFMADNDQGWVPDETKTNSAQMVMRQDGHVSLVLNLVARPFTFTGPRRITFGLQATPVKAIADDYRSRLAKLDLNVAFTGFDPAGKGWDWNGQMAKLPDGKLSLVNGHGSNPYPLNWALSRRRGATNPRSPFMDGLENGPTREAGSEGYVRSLRGSGYLPYQALNAVLQPAEIEHPLVTGIHGVNFYGYLGPVVFSDREWGDVCISGPDMDYRLWHYKNWIRNSYLDGFYFDNTYPTLDAFSSGYPLDLPDRPALNGKIQPGYALMNQRTFFKRLRTVFNGAGVKPMIWLHATDAFVIPAFSFADVVMDGEHFPGLTPEKPWSSERWQTRPPHMRAMSGADKWGLAVFYLPMSRGFTTPDKDLSARVYRNTAGYYALFDCPTEARWPVFELALERKSDFHPYWSAVVTNGIVCTNEGVKVSAWRQDNRLYLLAFNFSTQAYAHAQLQIQPQTFGLDGTRWAVRDLEPDDQVAYQKMWERKNSRDYNANYRGASLAGRQAETSVDVVVPLFSRNYRAFVVEQEPAASGSLP